MPGDTLYHVIDAGGDTLFYQTADDSIVLGIVRHIDQPVKGLENQTLPEWTLLIPFALMLIVFLIPIGMKRLRKSLNIYNVKRVFAAKRSEYDVLFNQYIPYYRDLSPARQERFIKRTMIFRASKQFVFKGLQEEKHMSLLISATAVQLTFGLDNYLLDHFTTIYVLRNDYHYGLFNVPFQGHVTHNGIYLSWNNFLNAWADYQDGDNVGLHEMAHALSYVNFTVNDGSDNGFKQRFTAFSITGRAVFEQVKSGEVSFLGKYASTNYEEFWAVCVENFFERSLAFKVQLPDLYAAMCNLLNQDLLSPRLFPDPVEDV